MNLAENLAQSAEPDPDHIAMKLDDAATPHRMLPGVPRQRRACNRRARPASAKEVRSRLTTYATTAGSIQDTRERPRCAAL
jgi:hypothetical protein